jgi:2-keto-4-pentenoate hydratase/2-oxohepta-3-ene-1,7-dioic acid hydratase in catechol pathway
MKIICVGRNYVDHAKELKNEVPTEPVIFLKPDTALLPKKQPFFIPDFSKEVHYEVEIVVRIDRIGKHIQKKFAHKYYHELTLGIDFTARDLQQELKSKGLPWEKATAFDGSAPIGEFVAKEKFKDLNRIDFSLQVNGELRQKGTTNEMLFSIDSLIEYVSTFFTLKIGDLIFTGTPAGVGKTKKNDHFEGYLGSEKVLDLKAK